MENIHISFQDFYVTVYIISFVVLTILFRIKFVTFNDYLGEMPKWGVFLFIFIISFMMPAALILGGLFLVFYIPFLILYGKGK